MLQVNFEPIKEPRGFIKILQFLFSICAFATTTSFSTYFTFHATVSACAEPGETVVRNDVSYPFALDGVQITQQLCKNPDVTQRFHFPTDTSSDAKFFVAIGVLSMLYAVGALVCYILFSERYANNRILPTVDFVVHVILAVLWLAAASAWASGATTLKSGCDPSTFTNSVCKDMTNVQCEFLKGDEIGSFAKLNISLILGFLNVFLWAANLWFLYKETPWFKGQPAAATPGSGSA